MKSMFSGEDGAASVLIIFMMLVLVTLGAFSITSARVNYIFSGKALDWKTEYYKCDALAESFLMDLDSALARAEKNTVEAMPSESAEELISGIYRNNVLTELSAINAVYPDMTAEGDEPVISAPVPAGGNSRLELKIAVLPFRYSITKNNGVTAAVLNQNAKRFAVLEWKQVQSEINEGILTQSIWDGEIQ